MINIVTCEHTVSQFQVPFKVSPTMLNGYVLYKRLFFFFWSVSTYVIPNLVYGLPSRSIKTSRQTDHAILWLNLQTQNCSKQLACILPPIINCWNWIIWWSIVVRSPVGDIIVACTLTLYGLYGNQGINEVRFDGVGRHID